MSSRRPAPAQRSRASTEVVPLRPPEPHSQREDPGAATEDPRRSDVDEWGRSERVRELARRIYGPMYSAWFRAEWEGLSKIPRSGGALLIGNHAGAIPSDAPVIMHGIETELGRPVYGLADYFFRTIPVVGTLWSRGGGVPARPDNAYRLLHDQGQLALVFPEGIKGTSKPYSDRYQLRRFGRGGFVEIAMRAGVPVVPIAILGSEETMPVLWQMPQLARALGLPYFPITANMLVMGPIGTVVPFPAKLRLRVLDPVTFDVEPDKERYPKSRVMEESERIRQMLQAALSDMLSRRRSIWFG
ncbi:MAG TPA: lysophospholipid acyltransferase family protein [Acidimicrobiales bacterium]|nr:lysophospholipid acyltransferase family protein [Acidimicrobiales bacterium]